MAQFADLHEFEHPSFTPLRLRDVDDNDHEFYFRSLLLGDQLLLEAFELVGDDEAAGYRFQILGEADVEPFALLAQLIPKVGRALRLSRQSRNQTGSTIYGIPIAR